jgi:hypothetical protein
MNKAKRCRSVILGASVAALGTTAACPAANAERSGGPVPASAPRAATVREHATPKRHVARHHGAYVYRVLVGGEIRSEAPNASCAGDSIRFTRVTFTMGESPAAEALSERDPSFWRGRFTVTAGPATTITMPWNSPAETREAEEHGGAVPNGHGTWATAPAARVCAATTPGASLGSIGEGLVAWSLPAPVTSVAALLAHAPTNATFNELMVAFSIQPDGSVPAFTNS